MKWIRTEHKLPEDGQCCYVVFDHDDPGNTAVWFAQYKNGKWYGYERTGSEEQLLNGTAICWMLEPENPFATDSDV